MRYVLTREELVVDFAESAIVRDWHWFRWHFERLLRGEDAPFADAILSALLDCDEVMPGYARRTLGALAAPHGRDRHKPDYEQIMQRLAEVLVVRRAVCAAWPSPATFADEPTSSQSAKNPEVSLTFTDGVTLGLEVKSPALLSHQEQRSRNAWQLPSRALPKEMGSALGDDPARVTMPRDNPIKDFLVSADTKFAGFKAANSSFVGVLVIVWDDFDFEPWTALLHPQSGLLTTNSFAVDNDGQPLAFTNVDGIIVTGHLTLLQHAAAEDGSPRRPFHLAYRALDWEHDGLWAGITYVENSRASGLPSFVSQAFGAREVNPGLEGAHEIVMWISPNPDSPLNRH